MKVYISADIEGIVGIANWDETTRSKPDYPPFAKEMMNEVIAACEGANEAGVKDIWIKDAHGAGRNLTFDNLPENVTLVRAFNGHPFGMMQEIDNSFYAVIMIGYHSMAGSEGNPLAHTLNDEEIEWIKINDQYASEFLLNAYTASYVEVPVIFVSGDEALCEHVKQINQNIRTVSVGKGVGSSVISVHPKIVCNKIKEEVKSAFKGNVKNFMIELPRIFKVEISYFHHYDAYKSSFYPGMKKLSEKVTIFETYDYFEVLRMLSFIC